jgi:glycosyltransferase involved in cell wall biosynthesis
MIHPHQSNNTLKKRVALAVSNDLFTDNRIHKVATTLLQMGFEVTLIGRILPSSPTLPIQAYSTRRLSLRFNKGPLFYANYNIRLFFFLLSKKFDVIVSNDLDTLPASYWAGKMTKKPLIYDSHEYFTEVPELVNRPLIKKVWCAIEKAIVPKLKNCYTVCQSIADIYNTKYQTNFKVVRNVPLRTVKTKSNITLPSCFHTDLPIILYQGAVNKGRGIEEAILAMHSIDQARLVIIGDGDLLETCKNIVTQEHLNDKISFTGRIPFNELQNITSKATIGLSIEKDLGLNYHYALPNKLFDYISAEIPVLAANLPEIKRIIDQYQVGLLLSETTPETIASQVNILLKSPKKLKEWSANCKIAKGELCWENEENILHEIYKPFL